MYMTAKLVCKKMNFLGTFTVSLVMVVIFIMQIHKQISDN